MYSPNRNKRFSSVKTEKKDYSSSSAFGKKSSTPIFGIHPILEAIRAGKDIEKVFMQKGTGNTLMSELYKEITEYKIPFQFVPPEKLNHLVKSKNHQGVVALLSPITYQNIENIIPTVFEKGETPLVLILDRITDVRNLGAIARTAECAGVHVLIVPAKGSAQINSDAIKTSAGAIFNLPICRSENLKHTIEFLKRSGLQIIGCTEKGNKKINELNFSLPTAIIIGSEEDGISEEYLNRCDAEAAIPLLGQTASLNVSVAAGITLYEVMRQKKFKK
ncbi:MAG: 23S rRNA (guanosine(2251)-2'-O)-methyltransferase RlmB [Bacteroidetes bacterium]|nr:23S rRNA (guanosine(2251)-2'-O)-methyltransferase RlmB [Bacteroidota bacterium]